MSEVLFRAALATAVAVVGGVIGVVVGASSARLSALVSAAAGALLAVTLVSILPEAAHSLGLAELLLAAASGYIVFYLVGRYIYPVCPACAASHFDEKTTKTLTQTALLLSIALTLHSILDGVAVAVGHEMHGGSDLPMLFAVAFHKLPEGLALAALLLSAGYRPRTALLVTTGIEMTTLVGGVLGAAALKDVSPFWLGVVMAHVGGGFLYLVFHTLGGGFTRERATQVGYGSLGFGTISLLLWSLRRI